jgi:hypothetical protein
MKRPPEISPGAVFIGFGNVFGNIGVAKRFLGVLMVHTRRLGRADAVAGLPAIGRYGVGRRRICSPGVPARPSRACCEGSRGACPAVPRLARRSRASVARCVRGRTTASLAQFGRIRRVKSRRCVPLGTARTQAVALAERVNPCADSDSSNSRCNMLRVHCVAVARSNSASAPPSDVAPLTAPTSLAASTDPSEQCNLAAEFASPAVKRTPNR